MQIFIPTYGRHDRQHTFNHLPPLLKKRTTLVVQARERKLYSDYPHIVLPKKIETISPARQWIMNYAKKEGIKRLCMLDDDLRFDYRRMDERGKFYVATPIVTGKLFLFS